MFEVEFVKCEEVAKLFHTTPAKIAAMILNHTLPIGGCADGATNRVFIVKKRLQAFLDAKDLGM